MPSATYTGTSERVYTQYLDVDPGLPATTLIAQPQVTYLIAAADDWQVGAIPGDGEWSGLPPAPPSLGAFNAIPGQAVAGQSPPGAPGAAGGAEDSLSAILGVTHMAGLAAAAPVTATFLGASPRVYTQYLDADGSPAGTTLVAVPQGTYQIIAAGGGLAGAVPGDGLWAFQDARPVGTRLDDDAPAARLGSALAVTGSVTATFLGTEPLTYTQYLDAGSTGTTLVAEPGNVYEISLADQWQLGLPPQDGLWGAVPQVSLDFTIVPGLGVPGGACPGFPGGILGPPPVREALTFGATIGLAVIGGMNPGFPGFTGDSMMMEGASGPEPAREALAVPAHRVVRGRGRKLRPAPERRRPSRRHSIRRDLTAGEVRAAP